MLKQYDNAACKAARIANDERPLVCGHSPSRHSEFTTGTAHTPDGREICWTCADKEQREAMKSADSVVLYLKDRELTTWSGGLMARVTSRVNRRNGFHRSVIVYFQAIDLDGKRWYGTSPGDGMYARLRANKR
jgi:hypothetical protein